MGGGVDTKASGRTPPGATSAGPDRRRLDRNRSRTRLVALIASVVAAVGVIVATSGGMGLTPDSVSYLSAGSALGAGRGYVDFGLTGLTVFPPGLPALIAVGDVVGVAPDTAARWVNVIAVGAIVWLGSVLLRRHVRSTVLVNLATIAAAVGVPLVLVARMVWSESLFAVVVLGFVLAVEEVVEQGSRRRWFWSAVALASFGFFVRYAGIVLAPAGAFAVLWCGRRTWRASLPKAMGLIAASLALPSLWMLRNLAADGTLMGPRPPSSDDLGRVGDRIVATLSQWANPSPEPVITPQPAGWILLGLLVAVAALAAATLFRRDEARRSFYGRSLLPLASVCLVYVGYLATAQVTTAFDPIDNRLLSPLYVPLLVLVAVGIDRIADALPDAVRRPLGTVGVVAICGVLIASTVAWVDVVDHTRSNDPNPALAPYATSALVAAIDGLPAESVVYTDAPEGVWVTTGKAVRQTPVKYLWRSEEVHPVPDSFADTVACHPTFLALFGDGGVNYSIDELQEIVRVEPLESVDDGTVYRLAPLVSASCGDAA